MIFSFHLSELSYWAKKVVQLVQWGKASQDIDEAKPLLGKDGELNEDHSEDENRK